jgi:hypothetical protein
MFLRNVGSDKTHTRNVPEDGTRRNIHVWLFWKTVKSKQNFMHNYIKLIMLMVGALPDIILLCFRFVGNVDYFHVLTDSSGDAQTVTAYTHCPCTSNRPTCILLQKWKLTTDNRHRPPFAEQSTSLQRFSNFVTPHWRSTYPSLFSTHLHALPFS